MRSGEYWILGEPFLKNYFTSVDLNKNEMRMYVTYAIEDGLLSPFDTTEGWVVMFGLVIGSIVVYLFTFFIYLKYEDYKKRQIMIAESNESSGRKKPRIL